MGPGFRILFALLFCATALPQWYRVAALNTNEAEAAEFLAELDTRYIQEANAQMEARWNYITDVTDANANNQIQANIKFQNFQLDAWKNVTQFDWSGFTDPLVKREFTYLNILGAAALQDADLQKYNELAAEMETIYSSATICPFDDPNGQNCNLALDPELTEIMAKSDNYDELQHVWTQWREKAGKPIREKYIEFVALNNKAAIKNSYPDMGSLWNAYYLYEGYNEDEFKAEVEALWNEVKPLYLEMYTYVRRILYNKYPGRFQRYGRMPAHILGNMWAQSWGNIARDVLPYDADPVDATPGLVEGGYDATKMFELSEDFFTGLGFEPMTDIFWEKSLIVKPTDRTVVCHASAEDFFLDRVSGNRTDFRIKMCTAVNQEDLITIHHEMGHIAYFMQYRDQHWVFRNGANPGFHEAIGDCLALAVATPAHLESVGLLKPTASKGTPRFKDLPELPPGVEMRDINYLMSQALEKVAFIPFGYLMDKWRWGVFSNTTTNDKLNTDWWALRKELQGLIPPVERSENDFDPGAKYHIPANVEYIRYFVSYMVQFQFYESLCTAAGKYDPQNPDAQPLYKCDFAGSTTAGEKLINMMKSGFSEPWPVALEKATGSQSMNASSIMNYFQPLYDWLKEANAMASDCVGWGAECEAHAREYMEGEYEKTTSELSYFSATAAWNYETNLTSANAENSTKWSLEFAKYHKSSWAERITQYEYEEFEDEFLKRQFEKLITLGSAALPEDKLTNLTNIVAKMSDQFASSKVCPYDNQQCDLEKDGLLLDPDLEEILVTSKDYDELSYVWKAWRDAASKPMRPDYKVYVNLSNEVAVANKLPDMSELWVLPYETPSFKNDTADLLKQMEPFYKDLHAYVRMKLRDLYGADRIDSDTPIPASILRNMWAQSWEHLYDIMAPYPDAGTVDVTQALIDQGYDPMRMFTTAEKFFTSLGLEPMPTTYGPDSMIVRPTDGRDVVCHASAWDFSNGHDFRIKMCTNVDMEDLITIHHELGHIQYYIQYKDLPVTFRDGANPGFHEAIGDTLALSVSTPKHMNAINLLNSTASEQSDLNFLMRTALEKVAFLPFAYVMDRWRWGVFSGEYPESEWNYHWWKLREEYQGLMPPVKRSEDDFDPGAKYHTAADVEYSRYFVAHILQFQLHKSLCTAAGQYDPNDVNKPLYRCDIYNNTAAGDKLRTLLKYGSSKPWRDILKEATGEDNLDSSAISEYFKPLHDYIKKQLADRNETPGWRSRVDEMFTKDDGYVDQTVPIVVGVVLAVLLVIVVVAYFVGDARRRKKNKSSSHHDPERRSSD